MNNYKITIQYDGTRYKGWQGQNSTGLTIQGKIEAVLGQMAGHAVEVIGSGRTDAGVHAKGQVANFHIEEHFTEGKIMSYLNHYLPDDIAVIAIEQVDERFHSRYAAKKKTYRYHIHMGEISDVFERKYEYQYEKILDVESMKEAASYLIGTHDFTSFCGNKKMKKTAVRTIYEINFTKKGNDLWIDYRGNGFLQNMVRILTGTLIEVGDGRRAPEELPQILESKNRENAGYTARNREVIGEAAFERYLNGSLKDLYDPHLLKDADCLTDILKVKIEEQKPIRIIGDYDIDGVMSTYILYRGIKHCGGNVSTQIPDRMKDGYGINENLIDQAKRDGMDTILTCDNGIAAISEIAHAKELGMTVLVTDHHEIPYTEENGEKQFLRSNADAIVNPKQQECAYPFKELCGAAVAWKVLQVLYEKMGFALEETYEFLENVAFATVGDVMDLTDENRILVKEGLNRIHRTKNPGMRALIFQNHLEPEQINAYHFGFVLGPCINASGRLDTAKLSLSLFLRGGEEAAKTARELVELNQQRKDMTADGVEEAKRVVEEHYMSDKVLVIYLPQVHESLAGIIAGRIREAYHKPVFVLTKAEEGVKGSGRSIEEYSMYEELCKCRELLEKFGGHPMAAGLSLPEENVDKFREKINACANLTEDDLIPKIKIDIPMPAAYADAGLIREFAVLEPFGKANIKPQFADKNLSITKAFVVGKNQNVLRLNLLTAAGETVTAVYFGDIEAFKAYYAEKYGSAEVEKAFRGQINKLRIMIVYYPEINEYNGVESVQVIIRNYQ